MLTIEDDVDIQSSGSFQKGRDLAVPEFGQMSFEENYLSEDEEDRSASGHKELSSIQELRKMDPSGGRNQQKIDPDLMASERKNLLGDTRRNQQGSDSSGSDLSWLRNEYDYLLDKMTRRKLEIIEEEDKFSHQNLTEQIESATIEITRMPTADLARKKQFSRSLSVEESDVILVNSELILRTHLSSMACLRMRTRKCFLWKISSRRHQRSLRQITRTSSKV